MILALAGGYGGARLAQGLYRALPPGELTVVVNTADDLSFHGQRICPDLDTVMYTLSGWNNRKTGWGIRGDTFRALEMLQAYGEPTWFKVGDKDLATHLLRTRLLSEGMTLTTVTQELAGRLGIDAAILPMCDEPVATLVDTPEGTLPFQEYFVRQRGMVKTLGLRFDGVERARLTEAVAMALRSANQIILCPSNPILSIAPILAVPGLRDVLRSVQSPIVAVSPLVGGKAVRGPLARLMTDLGYPLTQASVAGFYSDFLDGLVLDRRDAPEASRVQALGISTLVTSTLMPGPASRESLARKVLAFTPSRRQS